MGRKDRSLSLDEFRDDLPNMSESGIEQPVIDDKIENESRIAIQDFEQEFTRDGSFVIPYHFIPLKGQKTTTKSLGPRKSGKLEVTITTKTPIFIPNTTNDKYFNGQNDDIEHKSYDFYSYEDLSKKSEKDGIVYPPVIPGSAIRGCIRSVHEALNNSCVSSIDDDEMLKIKLWKDSYNYNKVSRTVKSFFGNYSKCSDENALCPTCQMFGYIANDDEGGECSKVRFCDAVTEEKPESCYCSPIVLPPLLGPHASNHFYFEVFDEYGDRIEPKGRKFYWNFGFRTELFANNAKTRLNNTIRPVKYGIVFKTTVYYDDLTNEQVESLIKAINLFDDNHYHKIGHAKAIGMGSVNMKVVKNTERTVSVESGVVRYKETSVPVEKCSLFKESDKHVMLMTDSRVVWNSTVKYPVLKWYNKNKTKDLITLKQKEEGMALRFEGLPKPNYENQNSFKWKK